MKVAFENEFTQTHQADIDRFVPEPSLSSGAPASSVSAESAPIFQPKAVAKVAVSPAPEPVVVAAAPKTDDDLFTEDIDSLWDDEDLFGDDDKS